MVRNVPVQEAKEIVDSVFDKCYNDLEPVGRQCRKNSRDADRALIEGQFYGYSWLVWWRAVWHAEHNPHVHEFEDSAS